MKFASFISAEDVWTAARRAVALRAPEGCALFIHVEAPLSGEPKEPGELEALSDYESQITLIQRYQRALGLNLRTFARERIPPVDEVKGAIAEYHRRIWEEGEASREGLPLSLGELLARREGAGAHPLAGAIYDLGAMAERQYAHGITPVWSGDDVNYMALTETLQRPKLPSLGAMALTVSGGWVHLSALFRQLEIPRVLAVLVFLALLLGISVRLANGVRQELRGDREPDIFRGLLPRMRPPEPVPGNLQIGGVNLLAAHTRWPRKISRSDFRSQLGISREELWR